MSPKEEERRQLAAVRAYFGAPCSGCGAIRQLREGYCGLCLGPYILEVMKAEKDGVVSPPPPRESPRGALWAARAVVWSEIMANLGFFLLFAARKEPGPAFTAAVMALVNFGYAIEL